MFKKKLHLHSMMVHVVAALAPLAAVAFVFLKLDIAFMSFTSKTWEVLVGISVPVMLLVAVPSLMTGVFERGHIYAKWHSTHKMKMLFSVVLVAALIAELSMMCSCCGGFTDAPLMGPFGILLVVVNNVASFFLGVYGLKISMGRQGLGKTSYEPDLFKKEPLDILTRAGELAKEEPKFIDLYEENR